MVNLSSCSSAFVPCSCLIYARSSWPRVGSEGVLIASCLGQNCVPKLLIGLIPMPKAQPGTGGLISTILLLLLAVMFLLHSLAEADTVPSYLCAVWEAELGLMECLATEWPHHGLHLEPHGMFQMTRASLLLLWKQMETLSFSHSLKMWRYEIHFAPTSIADLLVFVGILACMQKGNYVNHIPRKASGIILKWNNIRHYQLICM